MLVAPARKTPNCNMIELATDYAQLQKLDSVADEKHQSHATRIGGASAAMKARKHEGRANEEKHSLSGSD